MRTYHMKLDEVLKMRRRHFFWLVKQIGRLEASEDRRLLSVLAIHQSPEGVEKALKQLDSSVGEIYQRGASNYRTPDLSDDGGLDPEFDRAGLLALKAKHGS